MVLSDSLAYMSISIPSSLIVLENRSTTPSSN
jgi:hypothetical protein